jgi:hypothetical protein
MRKILLWKKLAPASVARWLESQERLKKLYALLVRLRLATPASRPVPDSFACILQDIACAQDDERRALAAIFEIERQHAIAKQHNKLRRLCHSAMMPSHPQQRKKQDQALLWLMFWRGWYSSPAPAPIQSSSRRRFTAQ